MKNTKNLIAIIIGVIILSASVLGQIQFHDVKNQAIEEEKKQLTQFFTHEWEQKQLRLIMALEFIDSFYRPSVSINEFNDIISEFLSRIPDFKNIIILEDSNIVQSFPHTEFVGMNLEDAFPDHPRIENGKLVGTPPKLDGIPVGLLIHPNISQNILVLVGVDYFVSEKNIPKNNYKIKFFVQKEITVYQLEKNGDNIITENIEFSENELADAIYLTLPAEVRGYFLNKEIIIDLIMWYETSENDALIYDLGIFAPGLVLSIIIPFLLIRTFRSEERLRLSNLELSKADKTKTLFLNNLTHELKTPLVPIQGNAEMLKNPKMGELNDMQKESVDEIHEHSTALLSTVENFLKLQKITENKLELKIQEIKVGELNEIISKITPGNGKKKIKLETVFDKELSVNADKSELIAIIEELVKNTTDFLPEQDGKIEVGAKEQNGNVIFSVKDNGAGIPKEKQTDIFKPFIKADMSQSRTHGGVGLGLSICKGLIEGMKGKIWVESEEGKGTTFFFTIPKAD